MALASYSGGYTVSDDTVRVIRNVMADTTRAITTATGLQGYQLEAPAKVIVPVITPLVNMIPRKKGNGNPICHWKSITSFDTARSRGWTTEGNLPSAVAYQEADLQQPYKTIALSNSVTFDAQWTGRSLEGDLRARRVGELLYQLKMREESILITGAQYLMPPPAPVLATAATGGTVAAATYWVQVTALNGSSQETTPGNVTSIVTTGATSTITITLFTVPDAAQYNVYVGSGATKPNNANMFLQAGISGANAVQPGYNTVVTLNGGGTTPTGEVVGPTLTLTITAPPASGTANPPATNAAKSFVDGNGNILAFDGIISQGLLNTTTANGLTLGAQVAQPAATNGVLALSDLTNLLMGSYNQAAGDPDFLVMHPIVSNKLTNLVIASGQTRYVVEANQPESSGKLVANYRVTHFLNQATGKEIPIIVDRYCPVDTIIGLPMSVPFPTNDIGAAIEIETNQEYWGIDYAITASSYPFGCYVNEAIKTYFLGGLCILRGITPSI